MNKVTDASVIVVSFNTRDLTIDCLKSVSKHTKDIVYELVVIDNASVDGSVKAIQKISKAHKNLTLVKSKENLGFGGGNNLGIKKAKGRYILLLNSDTKLHEDSISKMVKWMDANPKSGVSTCRLINPDKSVQPTGGLAPTPSRLLAWSLFFDDLPFWNNIFGSYHPHVSFYKKARELDWVTGAFMMIRREALEEVGNFDSEFFMYTEDVEYSFRFKSKGWEIWYVPITSILHIGGASSQGNSIEFSDGTKGKEKSIVGEFEGLKLFYKKHLPNNYQQAMLIMKLGALLRIVIFGLFRGHPQAISIYKKAFYAI